MDLKIDDVADLLNVSVVTIRRWLKDGKIPAYRINHQYRFSRIEIENWVLSCKLNAAEAEVIPQEEQQEIHHSGLQQYSLYRAIYKGGVIGNITGENKEEIIRGSMKLISQNLGLDAEIIADLLMDRENLMPTAINHGFAVPHTRDFVMEGTADAVVVVYPYEPIAYGALDGQPVHTLFFLFATSDKKHLHLLAKLAHLSSHHEAQALLKRRAPLRELLDFIKEWEENLRH